MQGRDNVIFVMCEVLNPEELHTNPTIRANFQDAERLVWFGLAGVCHQAKW